MSDCYGRCNETVARDEEIARLRAKIGEWADLIADGHGAPLNEMREEASNA